MAPDRDDEPVGGPEAEDWEEPPRSIFSTTWFRAVIVVLVVGAVAAVSIPYVMDAVSPPRPAPAPARVATPPAPPPAPAAPAAPTASAPAPTPPSPKSPPVASAVTKPAELPQPAAKSEAAKPVAPKVEPARPAAPKAAKQVAQAPKAETPPAAKSDAPPKRTARATAPAAERGDMWVQVGAFRDAETAKRVADGLRGKGFQVAESTTAPAAAAATTAAPSTSDAGDRYDVIVAGGAPGDVAKKLSAKGLSAEERRDGAVVRPSLPLRDAVTLSNDLRGEGLTVTVRRALAPGAAAPTTPAAAGGATLHRVRVGAFADRASARAAVEKLQALGYTPFIAKGRE